jgi:hypothetical protein
MTKFVTIYGERCSGTNYLEALLTTNYDVDISWKYGWKHFFGFRNLKNSDDTLFIGIIRNPYDWINSLYRDKYHLPAINTSSVDSFLNNEFYSIMDDGGELMRDRNIYTKERYKNIFDMRHTKNQFLIEDMPKLVKNYLLITHEALLYDFTNTMNKITSKGLNIKSNIEFPLNIIHYKKQKRKLFVLNKNPNHISKEQVMHRFNMHYEKMLFKDYL